MVCWDDDCLRIESLLELETLRSAATEYRTSEGEFYDEDGESMASYLLRLCDVVTEIHIKDINEGRYSADEPFELALDPDDGAAAEIVLAHCATSHPEEHTRTAIFQMLSTMRNPNHHH
jgi:hypothetical protein